MFTPYDIDKVKDPVRLYKVYGQREAIQGSKIDVQMHMVQKTFRRIRKPAEENVDCLVDLVIELLHG